jgi:hypothetical protein
VNYVETIFLTDLIRGPEFPFGTAPTETLPKFSGTISERAWLPIQRSESAVRARGFVSLEKAASDREIRALLGQRLREQCDIVQQIPVSERLSELIERLVQLEGREREPE